jgi:putative methyltransferase (TIGR04325 family)
LFFKKNKKQKELPYGWSGNYKTWDEAFALTKGYNENGILEKVKSAALKVKKGEAVYERDSVLFDKVEYSWGLLAILLKAAIENGNQLRLIDFGGSLGSTYFQNRGFLSVLKDVQWHVVEQKHFSETGAELFADEHLHFYDNLEKCTLETKSNIFLASSVIQYLKDPFEMIAKIISFNYDYIIFDRTAFVEGESHIITVQRVPPEVYEATYPAWFFNNDKFIEPFLDKYEHLADFDNGFTAPMDLNGSKACWKGLIFKKKIN